MTVKTFLPNVSKDIAIRTEHCCITATSNKVGEHFLPNLAHVNIADLDFLKSHASVIQKAI